MQYSQVDIRGQHSMCKIPLIQSYLCWLVLLYIHIYIYVCVCICIYENKQNPSYIVRSCNVILLIKDYKVIIVIMLSNIRKTGDKVIIGAKVTV